MAFEYPFPEERIFRYQAMQDVLSRLVEDPYNEFTIGQLAEMVDANQSTVSKAVKLLREFGTIHTRPAANSTCASTETVSRNPTRCCPFHCQSSTSQFARSPDEPKTNSTK